MAGFCSLITLSLLLAVPAQRLLHPQSGDKGDVTGIAGTLSPSVLKAPLGEYENGFKTASAAAVRSAAESLLVRLAPGQPGQPGQLQVSLAQGIRGRPGGGTQRLWFASGSILQQGRDITLSYDAATGDLIQASINSGTTDADVSRKKSLSSREAIELAGRWMRKLGMVNLSRTGLTQTLPSAAIPPLPYSPEPMPGGSWRVWLRAREKPGGQPLTVEVRIGGTGDLISATVVERCVLPQRHLPRRSSRAAPADAGSS